MAEFHPERARRRNFNSLLILAALLRIISYFIVGIALVGFVVSVVIAISARTIDTMLQFIVASAGAVIYGLLLYLGSELIRLLVGIGRDIARMAGRWDASAPTRETPPSA